MFFDRQCCSSFRNVFFIIITIIIPVINPLGYKLLRLEAHLKPVMKLHKPRDYKRQFTVCAYMRDIDSNYLPVAKTFGHFSRPLKNFLKTFKDVSKIFLTIHKSLAVRKLVQIPPLLGALLTASRDY